MKRIKKRKKRIFWKNARNIGCMVLIVFLLFKVTMVDAGINDSVVLKNRYDNIYAVTNIGGVNRIFYLNMYTLNGRYSYCIELGVDITSEIYNSTTDFNISNLSREQIDYVRNVSHFGMGYIGHNNIKYYMAAQEIIWEYLSGVEIEWTNVLDVNGERIDISSFKNEILSLVKGVEFKGYSEGMKVNIGGRVILNDYNNNLKNYDLVLGEHSKALIDGNRIVIDFFDDYVGEETITLRKKKIFGYNSALYYQGTSQKLISNGNIEEIEELKFDVIGKSVSFQLVDSIDIKHNNQFNYLGIYFELMTSDGEMIRLLESNEDGKLFVDNLAYGDYYLRQVSTNSAYHLSDKEYHFTIDGRDDVVFLELEPIVNEIKILKLYGDNEIYKEEVGIIFNIYNINDTLYDSVITLDNGIGSIKVPYGEYIVKQENSSVGYEKIDDFYLDGRNEGGEVFSYNLLDKAIKINLIINSKDMNGNFVLEDGIGYKLKKGDDYLEVDGVKEFNSTNGSLILPSKIGYGDYCLEIIDNSINYNNKDKFIYFSVDDNSNFIFDNGSLYLELDINYEEVKGNVKVSTYNEEVVYKDNSYSYEYVKSGNKKLELNAAKDIIINNQVIITGGSKIMDIVTDNDGNYLINDLYLGSYCLVYNDEIDECFDVVNDEVIEVELKEMLKKGQVNIHNISSEMEDIMGTTVEIINKDGQVVYIGITNEFGLVKVNDLVYGDYCFLERSVDDKYLINEDKFCFSVDNEKIVELEIVNKKIGKKLIQVPDTFSDKKSIRKLILLLCMIIGGIIYKIKISSNVS